MLKPILFIALLFACSCGKARVPEEQLSTVELFSRIDVERDGLAGIASLCYLENGDLAVLDQISGAVHIYRDGVHFMQISSIGEGPLECTAPTELAGRPGGGFILNCPADRKMLFYNAGYECSSEVLFNGCALRPGTPVRLIAISDSCLIGLDYIFDEDEGCGTRLCSWDVSDPSNPARQTIFHTRLADSFHPIVYIKETAIAFSVLPDGEALFISEISPESYEVNQVTLQNQHLATISGDATPVGKTQEEMESETLRLRNAWIRGTGSEAGFEFEADPLHNIVQSLYCSSNGDLWVRRGPVRRMCFDIYGPANEPSRELEIVVGNEQEMDGWLVALGHGSIAVAPFNPEEENVIYYGETDGVSPQGGGGEI